MPKTKNGGYILDDSALFSKEDRKELAEIAKNGNREQIREFIKKVVMRRFAIEQQVVAVNHES